MQVCPICHSPINVTDIQKEELRSRGVYTWLDDPILTDQGYAGDQFKGWVFFNWRHIKEIQEARVVQEVGAEIINKTTFSTINATIELKKDHINELRISTEKILTKLALSSPEINLTHYFNYDRDGTYHGTWKHGEKIIDKTEWTDIDRTTGFPSLPSDVTDIRAIHIEELRCQIPVTVEEPPFYGLDIIPGYFSFNLRCPDVNQPIEFKIYFDGLDITPDNAYIFNTSIAKITNYFNQYYVTPLLSGNTTMHAGHCIYTATGEHCYNADAFIIVSDIVRYSGATQTNIAIERPFGSGIGCDSSTLNWLINSKMKLSGQWDIEISNIPIQYNSYPIYAINPINSNEYPYPYRLYQNLDYPAYGILEGYYSRSWTYNTVYGATANTLPNGYTIRGTINQVLYGTFKYVKIDANKDGILDTWVYNTIYTHTGGNWNIQFSK